MRPADLGIRLPVCPESALSCGTPDKHKGCFLFRRGCARSAAHSRVAVRGFGRALKRRSASGGRVAGRAIGHVATSMGELGQARGTKGYGSSTLTVGTPTPARAMTAEARCWVEIATGPGRPTPIAPNVSPEDPRRPVGVGRLDGRRARRRLTDAWEGHDAAYRVGWSRRRTGYVGRLAGRRWRW